MSSFPVVSMICVIMLLHFSSGTASDSTLQTYIVHVELPDAQVASDESFDLESYYQSFMPTMTTSSASSSESPWRIIFSYLHVFPGFAAKLTADDVKEMTKKSGFIMANPEEIIPLHTTHSPEFLGLHQGTGIWEDTHYGKGTIIAVLDSGFTPGHPSFDGTGMPPPPATWKGTCDLPGACNNKVIGARSFVPGYKSQDDTGHGTHTASTASGSRVDGANVFGSANGTAVGVAPMAHVAIYKVCQSQMCRGSSILKGIDQAIEDKVDVISMSIGAPSVPYSRDDLAIGAYSAMKKNIVVICSAGNLGPVSGKLSNEAPWITTVGASTTDRDIVATVVLGDGQVLNGQCIYQPSNWAEKQLELVYDNTCEYLNPTRVKGKCVVCGSGGRIGIAQKGYRVREAGGVAMIYPHTVKEGYTFTPTAFEFAAAEINYEDGEKLMAYNKSTPSPTVTITFNGTQFGDKNAPTIAYFSSRGPSQTSPDVLKPDITAPGVNILAAWHYSVENNPKTKKNFNIISGTSMACPHVSGVAALIKSKHPNWSPAAIKSAMVTTADVMNLGGELILDQMHNTADPFATGAGHVNPTKASDPGLVYDIAPKDYLPYMCDLGYTSAQIKRVTGETYTCPEQRPSEGRLNYPSFTVKRTLLASTQTVTRTLTNVGEDANETYMVTISPPQGVQVNVVPGTLTFTQVGQKLQYKATFTQVGQGSATSGTSAGHITWTSDKHSVRSPIAAY